MKIHFLEAEDAVEFDVNPCELVGSVAIRYAKAKGMPQPPPDMVPTLRGAVGGLTIFPRITIGEAVRAGTMLFVPAGAWSK